MRISSLFSENFGNFLISPLGGALLAKIFILDCDVTKSFFSKMSVCMLYTFFYIVRPNLNTGIKGLKVSNSYSSCIYLHTYYLHDLAIIFVCWDFPRKFVKNSSCLALVCIIYMMFPLPLSQL